MNSIFAKKVVFKYLVQSHYHVPCASKVRACRTCSSLSLSLRNIARLYTRKQKNEEDEEDLCVQSAGLSHVPFSLTLSTNIARLYTPKNEEEDLGARHRGIVELSEGV